MGGHFVFRATPCTSSAATAFALDPPARSTARAARGAHARYGPRGAMGRTSNFSAAQEIALEALTEDQRQATAATAAGVSPRTIRRWLDDPAFAAELAERRGRVRAAYETLLDVLQKRDPDLARRVMRTLKVWASEMRDGRRRGAA